MSTSPISSSTSLPTAAAADPAAPPLVAGVAQGVIAVLAPTGAAPVDAARISAVLAGQTEAPKRAPLPLGRADFPLINSIIKAHAMAPHMDLLEAWALDLFLHLELVAKDKATPTIGQKAVDQFCVTFALAYTAIGAELDIRKHGPSPGAIFCQRKEKGKEKGGAAARERIATRGHLPTLAESAHRLRDIEALLTNPLIPAHLAELLKARFALGHSLLKPAIAFTAFGQPLSTQVDHFPLVRHIKKSPEEIVDSAHHYARFYGKTFSDRSTQSPLFCGHPVVFPGAMEDFFSQFNHFVGANRRYLSSNPFYFCEQFQGFKKELALIIKSLVAATPMARDARKLTDRDLSGVKEGISLTEGISPAEKRLGLYFYHLTSQSVARSISQIVGMVEERIILPHLPQQMSYAQSIDRINLAANYLLNVFKAGLPPPRWEFPPEVASTAASFNIFFAATSGLLAQSREISNKFIVRLEKIGLDWRKNSSLGEFIIDADLDVLLNFADGLNILSSLYVNLDKSREGYLAAITVFLQEMPYSQLVQHRRDLIEGLQHLSAGAVLPFYMFSMIFEGIQNITGEELSEEQQRGVEALVNLMHLEGIEGVFDNVIKAKAPHPMKGGRPPIAKAIEATPPPPPTAAAAPAAPAKTATPPAPTPKQERLIDYRMKTWKAEALLLRHNFIPVFKGTGHRILMNGDVRVELPIGGNHPELDSRTAKNAQAALDLVRKREEKGPAAPPSEKPR